MNYDYRENVKEDIINYIKENYDKEDILELNENQLYDDLFINDSVTGNGSGSYTFNTYQAEEYICHNLDLLREACNEFCCEIPEGAEACDVTIRCYLLGQLLDEVLDELKNEIENEEEVK